MTTTEQPAVWSPVQPDSSHVHGTISTTLDNGLKVTVYFGPFRDAHNRQVTGFSIHTDSTGMYMQRQHNYRHSEADAYAAQYRAALSNHIKQAYGDEIINRYPGTDKGEFYFDESKQQNLPPDRRLGIFHSPRFSENLQAEFFSRIKTAHEAVVQELGPPPRDHDLEGKPIGGPKAAPLAAGRHGSGNWRGSSLFDGDTPRKPGNART